MQTKHWAFGLAAIGLVTIAPPAFSQGIEIGPDGVRIIEPRDRYDDRRDERYDRRRDISEREAVRIARSEGLREVDDIRRTRRTFRIIGADRRGRDIRVDIDRRTGEVLSVR